MVAFMEVPDCPAIADDMALKTPLFPQDIPEQGFAAAGRLAIDSVVGTHHRFDIRLAHQRLKGRQIGFPQVLV